MQSMLIANEAGDKLQSTYLKAHSYEQSKQGMSCLVSFHLEHHSNVEQVDAVLAHIIFNEGILLCNATNAVIDKIAGVYNSIKFNAVVLLKSLGPHTGFLNDTCVNQYALIGNPKGNSLLHKRYHLTDPCKAANNFIHHQYGVEFTPSTEFGETFRA